MRGEARSPIEILEAEQRAAVDQKTGPDGFRLTVLYGLAVGSLKGAENLTVIEQPLGGTLFKPLCQPISALAPDWEIASLKTLFHAKSRQAHGLTIWRKGKRIRRTSAHLRIIDTYDPPPPTAAGISRRSMTGSSRWAMASDRRADGIRG